MEGRNENQRDSKPKGDMTQPCWLEDGAGGLMRRNAGGLKLLRKAPNDSQ